MHIYNLCTAIHQKTQLSCNAFKGIFRLHPVIPAVSVKTRSKSKRQQAGAEIVPSSGTWIH